MEWSILKPISPVAILAGSRLARRLIYSDERVKRINRSWVLMFLPALLLWVPVFVFTLISADWSSVDWSSARGELRFDWSADLTTLAIIFGVVYWSLSVMVNYVQILRAAEFDAAANLISDGKNPFSTKEGLDAWDHQHRAKQTAEVPEISNQS